MSEDDNDSRRESIKSAWVEDMHRRWENDSASPLKSKIGSACACTVILIMAGGYLALFSRMDFSAVENSSVGSFVGYGAEIFVLLTGNSAFGYYTGALAFIGLCSLYILDVLNWKGMILWSLGQLLLLACVGLLMVTCLLFSESFPSAPFGVYFFTTALAIVTLSRTIFYNVSSIYMLGGVCIGLVISSIGILILWIVWVVVEGRSWDVLLKLEFYTALNCPISFGNITSLESLAALDLANLTEFFSTDEASADCEFAFFLWVSPFIYFACCFPFAVVLFFVVRAQREIKKNDKAARVDPLAQLFMGLITLSILGMWVAASIASATSSISTTILAFSLLAFGASIGISFGTFGAKYMKSQLIKTPLGAYAYGAAQSDWAKGFGVVVLTPVVIFFLFLNFLTQLTRKYTCLGKNIDDPAEKSGYFTVKVAQHVSDAWRWDWGSVLIKSLYWGIFFFVVVVGVARLTTVFLSWLRVELVAIDFGVTLAIFVTVGIIMFLLPPVPGVPVYIAGGIILTSKTEEQFGFIGGMLFTLLICFCLKMTAICMQQKLIGELFGARSVYVRSLVSINSRTLRAMKLILSKPGLHIAKVVVLIGGPDWPTSVLTGIMKLPLCQMLLGSTPVVFLIAPCVVSGAMLVKAGEGGIYTSLNTVSITLTFVVQSASMLAAMHFLAKKVVQNEKEIDAMEIDKEVEARDQRTENKRIVRKEMGSWAELPRVFKVLHVVAAVLMIMSCYAFQLLGTRIFVTYSITDTIEDTLDGNVLNLIIQPFGLYPLAAFALSCTYLFVYNTILGRISKAEYNVRFGDKGAPEVAPLEI